MPIYHRCEQRSEEWHRIRLGVVTASAFDRIVTPKGKLSAQSEVYINHLLAEMILGTTLEETMETKWMEHGRLTEPEAIASYEFETDRETQAVGFVTSWDGAIGCSPDRLVGEVGLLELKCPAPKTHMGYLRSRSIEEAYKPQVHGQLLVTEREWLDLQSHCAGLPAVIVRVERDDAYIALLMAALREFVEKLLAARADLESRYGPFRRETKPAVEYSFGLTDEDMEAIVRERFPVIPEGFRFQPNKDGGKGVLEISSPLTPALAEKLGCKEMLYDEKGFSHETERDWCRS